MHAQCALPNVSSLWWRSPQRVYVEDSLMTSLFVSFTDSSHGIQVALAAVRAIGLLSTNVEMAGCSPRIETRHWLIRLKNVMISLHCEIEYLITLPTFYKDILTFKEWFLFWCSSCRLDMHRRAGKSIQRVHVKAAWTAPK